MMPSRTLMLLAFVAGLGVLPGRAQAPPPTSDVHDVYAALLADPRCNGRRETMPSRTSLVVLSSAVSATKQSWWRSETDLPSLLRTSFRGLLPATLGNFI